MLNREEVAGVIAHELAHIKNRDTLTMTITATIAGAISMLAQFGMFFGGGHRDNNSGLGIIGTHRDGDPGADRRHAGADGDQPHARIRRRQPRRADLRAARMRSPRRWPRSPTPRSRSRTDSAERNPATAHLFIINPLTGHGMDNLFSTHPVDREPHRRAQAAGARDGPGRLRRPRGAPAYRAARRPGPWGNAGGARPWG